MFCGRFGVCAQLTGGPPVMVTGFTSLGLEVDALGVVAGGFVVRAS